MRQNGRKSTSASIVEAMVKGSVIEGGFSKKAEPPKTLPERATRIWRETVKAEPVDFFATAATQNLLDSYCRHRAVVEEMSELIDAFDKAWLAEAKGMRRYEWLLKTRRQEEEAATLCATKLRLTNQSRVHRHTAASRGAKAADGEEGESPWGERAQAEA